MDDKTRMALEQMPEKTRSKLDPHADVIRELRRKGHTYQDIADFLVEHLNVTVAPSTIHAFVRVRARRGRRFRIELPPRNTSRPFQAANSQSDAEIRRRIEELKNRRTVEESEKPRFEYDENGPLELIRETMIKKKLK
jgi:hypothetical protein